MCRADPEQAGVLFSCSEAEWTRSDWQRLAWGSAHEVRQECLGPGQQDWRQGGWEQDAQPLHACLACHSPSTEGPLLASAGDAWEGSHCSKEGASLCCSKSCWLGPAWEP